MVYVYIFRRFLTFVSYKHCLMVEKGDIVSNCPKQSETVSKMMSSHRRSLVRVYWEYICWFQKCFRQVLFVQWTFDPIFCHRGCVQQYNTLMTQLFFFGQTLLFSLSVSTFFLGLPVFCNPQSFLYPFLFVPLFLFLLTLHCFISRLLGWKEFRWRPPLPLPQFCRPVRLTRPTKPTRPTRPNRPTRPIRPQDPPGSTSKQDPQDPLSPPDLPNQSNSKDPLNPLDQHDPPDPLDPHDPPDPPSKLVMWKRMFFVNISTVLQNDKTRIQKFYQISHYG